MATPDFFRSRIDAMIDLRDPLAVLATRLPWQQIEASIGAKFERQYRAGEVLQGQDLFGTMQALVGVGVSSSGRPKLPIRLMASLLYLKHCFNVSDEVLVVSWSQNILWQFFSGMAYYEHRLPCDATQVGRFRKELGEEGLELLLKATIETAVAIKAIKPVEFERLIVDSTVQEKAIAHPTDSRLLERARHKVVGAAKRAGLELKQTFVKEGRELSRRAGGYAHAKQFGRMRRVIKRQRTILGRVIRDVHRKTALCAAMAGDVKAGAALARLNVWVSSAQRIQAQQRHDKNKLYALHAPEVECIGKGKATKPYEFGVKVGVAVTYKQGLLVGVRSFTGNPFDGHTLAEQMEQTTNLLQDIGVKPKQVVVDLGYRGKDVDAANPCLEIIHRGRYKSLTTLQRKWLKRRQAVEPAIGHLKSDNRMDRCWLSGATGDALHALSCALGYNLRWLMRAVVRLGLKGLLLCVLFVRIRGRFMTQFTLSSTPAHAASQFGSAWPLAIGL